MIIVLKNDASPEQVQNLQEIIRDHGYTPYFRGNGQTKAIGVTGAPNELNDAFCQHPGVEETFQHEQRYLLASRDFQPDDTTISIPNAEVGGAQLAVMAGPCAVESYEQTRKTAKHVKEHGAHVLRGGAYKPRTSPHSFQGLKEKGLEILKQVREEIRIPIITEVMAPEHIEAVNDVADILQLGSRNMQNFPLLKEAGKTNTPVLLKRAMSGTINEFLLAAEYILNEGNPNVMLCPRGIKTFVNETRNTLDISAVPVLSEKTHLPVIVDPSHASGNNKYVPDLALAASAAGAEGVLVEVHPDPPNARCDGAQSLTFDQFESLVPQLNAHRSLRNKWTDDEQRNERISSSIDSS